MPSTGYWAVTSTAELLPQLPCPFWTSRIQTSVHQFWRLLLEDTVSTLLLKMVYVQALTHVAGVLFQGDF